MASAREDTAALEQRRIVLMAEERGCLEALVDWRHATGRPQAEITGIVMALQTEAIVLRAKQKGIEIYLQEIAHG